MKNSLVILLILTFTFLSCQKEDISESDKPTGTNLENNDNAKVLIVNGQPVYVGYGFNISDSRVSRPAIETDFVAENTSSDFRTYIEVTVIAESKDVLDYVEKTKQFGLSLAYPLPGLGGFSYISVKFLSAESVANLLTIDKDHVSVIARVIIPHSSYTVGAGEQFLEYRAERFLERAGPARFMSKFGSSYLESNVLGADLTYTFEYNLSEKTEQEKKDFLTYVAIGILPWFEISVTNQLQTYQKESIRSTYSHSRVVSNLSGFAPRIITDANDVIGENPVFQSELFRIGKYMDDNPTLVGTLASKLQPYTKAVYDPNEYPELLEEYNRQVLHYQTQQ